MRIFWLILAIISFLLGVIGLLLPIVPQIPFFVLFIFSLAKFSPSFHKWFESTNFYKRIIEPGINLLYRAVDKKPDSSLLKKITLFFLKGISSKLKK